MCYLARTDKTRYGARDEHRKSENCFYPHFLPGKRLLTAQQVQFMEAISRNLFSDFSWCLQKQQTKTFVSEKSLAHAIMSRKTVVSHLNTSSLTYFFVYAGKSARKKLFTEGSKSALVRKFSLTRPVHSLKSSSSSSLGVEVHCASCI